MYAIRSYYENGLRDYSYRFDVVSLMGEEVTWIKNSIWGDEIGF